MIDRHDPSRALGLRQVMDRLLEDAFVSPRGLTNQAGNVAGPALNIYEEGEHFVVETQLPGWKPEDINVTLEQGLLTIQGETQAEEERQGRNYLVREHRTGRFSRSLRLPETVDEDAVQATYEHGVLRLTLPKAERAKSRRIQIGGSSQPAITSGPNNSQGAKGSAKPAVSARSS
jgi:HSP20 family protein